MTWGEKKKVGNRKGNFLHCYCPPPTITRGKKQLQVAQQGLWVQVRHSTGENM